jgi:hypothetical protein
VLRDAQVGFEGHEDHRTPFASRTIAKLYQRERGTSRPLPTKYASAIHQPLATCLVLAIMAILARFSTPGATLLDT